MSDIKLAYCTNLWSHHQAPLCNALSEQLNPGNFSACVFEDLHEERKLLGWNPLIPQCEWILGPPANHHDLVRLHHTIMDADVAVMGSCPPDIRDARIATGKLTLIMSERLWKKPYHFWRMLNPRFANGVRKYKEIVNRQNVHYLAMGSFAAEDVARIGAYENRVWAWPYFASVNPAPPQPRRNLGVRILWVGRMLEWKRVDLLLRAAALISEESKFEQIDLVGTGPVYKQLFRLSKKLNLDEKVIFHEPMQPNIIREMMRHSDIYVLPSNRGEGWGVVANEAMSEGCVLVANEQAGVSLELIKQGITGFTFRDNSIQELAEILKMLINTNELRDKVRYSAWEHINKLWHPRVGAERLVSLCSGLLGKSPMPNFDEGPCRNVAVRH